MIDLTDVTFLIPYRKDSDQRLRNLKIVINYIKKHFECIVMVVEDSAEQTFFDTHTVDYYMYKHNTNEMFHRTKILNDMAKLSNKSIICLYDTDVIFNVEQYVHAITAIRTNALDVVYPYDGRFYNIDRNEDIEYIKNTSTLDTLKIESCSLYHPNSVGGCIFFKKDVFMKCGMENENFKSWGFEDNSRVVTHQKLGSRIGRISGPLYHLNHPTSVNSSNTRHDAYIKNEQEYHKVANMSVSQLRSYVNTWEWAK